MTLLTRLIAFLRALLTALFPPTPEQPQPPALAKLPGVYAAIRGTTRLTDTDMARLRAVPALRSAWVGYDNGGFDWPADVRPAGAVLTQTVEGDWYSGMVEWYAAASAPGELWVLVYARPDDLDWTCDAQGEHCGTHPSGGAWVVDAGVWKSALEVGE